MDDDITIALNPRKGVNPSLSGNAQKVNENGTPVCKAGMLMRLYMTKRSTESPTIAR
jgi:hypothetical protein